MPSRIASTQQSSATDRRTVHAAPLLALGSSGIAERVGAHDPELRSRYGLPSRRPFYRRRADRGRGRDRDAAAVRWPGLCRMPCRRCGPCRSSGGERQSGAEDQWLGRRPPARAHQGTAALGGPDRRGGRDARPSGGGVAPHGRSASLLPATSPSQPSRSASSPSSPTRKAATLVPTDAPLSA